MFRRIFSISLVLGFLLLSLFTFRQQVKAQSGPSATPTVFRTPTSLANANFVGSPLSGAAPLAVQFTHGNNTAGLSSCTWLFGDGTNQSFNLAGATTCPSVTHTYTTAGSFNVTLYVTKATTGITNQMQKLGYVQVSGPGTLTPTPSCSSLTITGRVYSTMSQANIAGATVTANTSVSHPFSTTTAADGTYSLNIPAASNYACLVTGLSVTASGYQGTNRTISSSQLFLQPVQNFGLQPLATQTTPTRTPTPVSTNNDVPWPDLTISSVTYVGSNPACINSPKVQVVVANIGAFPANGSFSVSLTGSASQTVNGLAAGQSVTLIFSASGTMATADSTNSITETNESNNSLTGTFGIPTQAPTCTPTSGTPLTPTRTPTPGTPTRTPTITPTSGPPTGGCSPVTSTITAPFTFDGAGTLCWQSSNLGTFINSWNTTSVTLNGVNVTNIYVASGSYPAKIGGFWYVAYNSAVAWGHFEAK